MKTITRLYVPSFDDTTANNRISFALNELKVEHKIDGCKGHDAVFLIYSGVEINNLFEQLKKVLDTFYLAPYRGKEAALFYTYKKWYTEEQCMFHSNSGKTFQG